jgi:cytochrome subunit of sulfide dehydrogenase
MTPPSTSAQLSVAGRRALPLDGRKLPGWRAASAAIKVIACAMLADLIFLVAAAADNQQGAQLVATCASCHRLDGRDDGIPSIVGLEEKSLARTMLAYKSGERRSMIMQAVAASLSDEEIAAVAHYLAALRKESKRP